MVLSVGPYVPTDVPMNLRNVDPSLRSLRRLRLFACIMGPSGEHGPQRRCLGVGLGESARARPGGEVIFCDFRVFVVAILGFNNNVKVAVRGIFPRFLAHPTRRPGELVLNSLSPHCPLRIWRRGPA